MTPEELSEIASTQQEAVLRFKHRIHVCTAASCLSSGSDRLKQDLTKEVVSQGRDKQCQVKGVGCMGLCVKGPLVAVKPDNLMYQNATPQDAADIIKSLDATPVARLECATDQPFFRRQVKIVLENSGRVDPEKIGDYIAANGYEALLKVLTEFSPGEVIEQVLRSGLRGRGGAGFSTGLKWSMVSKADSDRKYVISNGDEGDPGAFMDRSVLEGDPHRVLEGMAIAGYAVGASQGYIYVRAEYPLAIKNLRRRFVRLSITGCWARTFLARLSALTSICAWAPERLFAAKRRLSSPRSKASGACRELARLIRPRKAFGANPRSSTTWRRSPTSHRSSATGATGLLASGPKRARGPKSSRSPAGLPTRA